jgi:RNA polymerase sigma-70 factor (ECF subfamily)
MTDGQGPENSTPNWSDQSLLRRFQGGEQDAATQLFLKYASRLRALAASQTSPALASRFDPEDVVQSVFRTFFRRASKGLYEVPEGDELWQLLLVLALNKIRELGTFHRAQKRDVGRTAGSNRLDAIQPVGEHAEEHSLCLLKLVIDEFFESQPAVYREIATLRMEGYQVDEIARKTQRSKRTVERILSTLKGKMVELLEI